MKLFLLIGALLALALNTTGQNTCPFKTKCLSVPVGESVIGKLNSKRALSFSVSDEAKNEFKGARFSLYLYIEEMVCESDPFDKNPHYPLFDVGFNIPTGDQGTNGPCQKISKGEAFSLPLNDGSILGAERIVITPFGNDSRWSDSDIYAEFRAELHVDREIVLGDETPQVDFNMRDRIGYEVIVDEGSQFCTQNKETHSCAMVLSFSDTLLYRCKNWSDTTSKVPYVNYSITNQTGDIEVGVLCYSRHYDLPDLSVPLESFGPAKLSLWEGLEKNVDVTVTSNLQLYSRENYCPPGFFNCYRREEYSCIPHKWQCDGRSNCPNMPQSDEFSCRIYDDQYYCFTYSNWTFTYFILVSFVLLCGVIFIVHALRALCIRNVRQARRPRNSGSFPDPVKDVPPSYEQVTAPRV